MNASLKRIVTNLSLVKAGRRLVRRLPIEHWPRVLGRIYGVATQRVVPLPVRTEQCGSNAKIILRLLTQTLSLPGDLAECGVYQGHTLIAMGLFLRQRNITKTLFGFDSFEGFDQMVLTDLAMGGAPEPTKRVGGFDDTSADILQDQLRAFSIDNRVRLVKGYFEQTLPAAPERCFCFVHLDVDIYDSYRLCLDYFYRRVVKGGIILLDEYNDPPWPGCNQAVDEFLRDKPETLREIDADNYVKHYIQKV